MGANESSDGNLYGLHDMGLRRRIEFGEANVSEPKPQMLESVGWGLASPTRVAMRSSNPHNPLMLLDCGSG